MSVAMYSKADSITPGCLVNSSSTLKGQEPFLKGQEWHPESTLSHWFPLAAPVVFRVYLSFQGISETFSST